MVRQIDIRSYVIVVIFSLVYGSLLVSPALWSPSARLEILTTSILPSCMCETTLVSPTWGRRLIRMAESPPE